MTPRAALTDRDGRLTDAGNAVRAARRRAAHDWSARALELARPLVMTRGRPTVVRGPSWRVFFAVF